jgi:hypothetical protein
MSTNFWKKFRTQAYTENHLAVINVFKCAVRTDLLRDFDWSADGFRTRLVIMFRIKLDTFSKRFNISSKCGGEGKDTCRIVTGNEIKTHCFLIFYLTSLKLTYIYIYIY